MSVHDVATAIAAHKYVSFTSYRKDGTSVASAVWIVALGDGKVGFTTEASSFKVKRIGRNPAVTLRPCDVRGRVSAGAVEVRGTAEVVMGAAHDVVWKAVRRKYRILGTAIAAADGVKRLVKRRNPSTANCAIVVTLG